MTRVPVIALVLAGTVLAGGLAAVARPGRTDVLLGVSAGAALSGGFAAVALAAFRRIHARGGEDQVSRMMRVFAGLMLARMIAYMALIVTSVVVETVEPVSVCIGLVGGTGVFQTIEILYLRKMT